MSGTIVHIGVKRRSGRYPWGSGGELISTTERLSAKGLSEKEIASGLGMSIQELRNQKSLAKAEQKEADRLNVIRQKERGMSIAAISRETNIAESTIRDLLKPAANLKFRIVQGIANKLREIIGKSRFVDIGEGSEVFMGVSETKLKNAVALLKNDGHKVYYLKQEQLGNPGKFTTLKVLGAPDSTWDELVANKDKIAIPEFHSKDKGLTFNDGGTINSMSSGRVLVKYKHDGGGEKDGLIEMRAGVPEFNLGGKDYAQVRIGVDGTHYMKGMAILRDDLPRGIDVVYNTNKVPTGNKLDAMKPLNTKEGAVSKVGAIVKANTYIDKNGKEIEGLVNIVGQEHVPSTEGQWATWKKSLASQILSKQAPRLASQQLDIIHENAKAELEDIKKLTNPTVRNHLLIEFADKVDKSAVDLQAAALPRQTTNVLLPDPKMRVTEIYAPNYNNGEKVALVRYPHGGVFEIPELTVNNKYSDYRKLIGPDAQDAVAIHPDVAQKLSGADFDGDTVLVIPNKSGSLKTSPSLKELKDFDPITAYPKFDGMKVLSEESKQREMGNVSNLITDMTIKGASQSEIASAVRHSMVVIDAAKHELNYKQSYIDNNIGALKNRYQKNPGDTGRGASTLISRTKAQERVLQRQDRYTIDPESGAKVYSYTDETYVHKKTGKTIDRTMLSTKGAEAKDAYDLSSGTVIESVYADHANSMKRLGNQARLASLEQKATPYNAKARATYKPEVESLDAKYKQAIRSKPIERKAQVLGEEIYKGQLAANPGMSNKDKQKWKGQSIQLARKRLDSAKPKVDITKKEWEAIEAGAISPTRLKGVLRNADMDKVRSYATPRATRAALSTGKTSRAKAMLKGGYTAAEVAGALGVPVNQIHDIE
jgi:transcriptional regulator with XRE-family HTH domain